MKTLGDQTGEMPGVHFVPQPSFIICSHLPFHCPSAQVRPLPQRTVPENQQDLLPDIIPQFDIPQLELRSNLPGTEQEYMARDPTTSTSAPSTDGGVSQ